MKKNILTICLILSGVIAQAQTQVIDVWNKLPPSLVAKGAEANAAVLDSFNAVLPDGQVAHYKKKDFSFMVKGSLSPLSTYDGSVFVDEKSMSTVWYGPEGMQATFTDPMKQYTLKNGKVEAQPHFKPILNENDELEVPKKKGKKKKGQPEGLAVPIPDSIKYGKSVINKTILLYAETCFDFFTRKKSKAEVVAEMGRTYEITRILYLREGIKVKLDLLFVWETVDPYAIYTNSNPILSMFAYNHSFVDTKITQHLGTIFNDKNYGGLGYVRGIGTTANFSYVGLGGYAGPTSTTVPNYIWSVACLAHELGHNIASKHTHWCGWVNEFGVNIGRLDSCRGGEANNGVSCGTVQKFNLNGTILSYCHTFGNINFAMGFGKYPRAYMREEIINNPAIPNDPSGPLPPCNCTPTVSACINGVITTTYSATNQPCIGACPGTTTRACSTATIAVSNQVCYVANGKWRIKFNIPVGSTSSHAINVCRYGTGCATLQACGSRGTYTPTAAERTAGLIDREMNPQPLPPSIGTWCYRASITVAGAIFWTPYFNFVR
jgi:hypothetical protein